MNMCVWDHPNLPSSVPSRSATATRRTPTGAQQSDRWAAAPVISLRVHVGAVCEQLRRHVRVPENRGRHVHVPEVRGQMERRPPAMERNTTAHSHISVCARVRLCNRMQRFLPHG